jgi:hypothetical protein
VALVDEACIRANLFSGVGALRFLRFDRYKLMLNLGWNIKMKDEGTGYNRQYRPWGQVRRRNLFARMRHILLMTVLGLASMALISLIAVFAASVVVIGFVVCAAIAVMTYLLKGFVRAPAKARMEGDAKTQAKGVFTARKVGNTWVSY